VATWDNATFNIKDGNVTFFSVAGQMANSQVHLTDPATSKLGTFTAGDWSSNSLIARTIGSFTVTGTPRVVPAQPFHAGRPHFRDRDGVPEQAAPRRASAPSRSTVT